MNHEVFAGLWTLPHYHLVTVKPLTLFAFRTDCDKRGYRRRLRWAKRILLKQTQRDDVLGIVVASDSKIDGHGRVLVPERYPHLLRGLVGADRTTASQLVSMSHSVSSHSGI